MDFLDGTGLDIVGALGVLLAAALVHVAVLRRLTTTLFDPVCYVALAGVFTLGISHVVAPGAPEAMVWLSYALFWLGVLIVAPKLGSVAATAAPAAPGPEIVLRLVVAMSVLLVVAMNLWFWLSAGIPAFSDNPTLAKGELYQGSFGFVRRLNWGLGVFALFGSLLLYFRHATAIWLIATVMLLGVAALGGGKGSLLNAVFVVGLTMAHPRSSIDGARARLGRRALITLSPLAVVAALAILLVEAGSPSGALQRLLIRLFYFGDIMLYWSDADIRREFLSLYRPADYPGHLLNPLLGLFRIVEYKSPIGNDIVSYSLGVGEEISAVLGPNTPFYIMGPIFFGPAGGLVYAFLTGCVFGWLRRCFVRASIARPLSFCTWGAILIVAVALPTQDDLFVGMVGDLLIPLGGLGLVAVTLVRASAAMPPRFGASAAMPPGRPAGGAMAAPGPG